MSYLASPSVGLTPGTMLSKRVVDIVISVAGLIALAPLLAVVAIIVRLDSPGPVIFRQSRVGRNGELFTMFKFRSMCNRSDDSIHRNAIARAWAGEKLSDDPNAPYKLTNDPRVTRVGHWLRRTSIDELPQLFNVLRGDMSIVGPRPMIPYELTNFESHHHERHLVLPGITGLAQIKCRGQANMGEMIEMDLDYVHSQSLYQDLKIILQTVPAVIRGAGAR